MNATDHLRAHHRQARDRIPGWLDQPLVPDANSILYSVASPTLAVAALLLSVLALRRLAVLPLRRLAVLPLRRLAVLPLGRLAVLPLRRLAVLPLGLLAVLPLRLLPVLALRLLPVLPLRLLAVLPLRLLAILTLPTKRRLSVLALLLPDTVAMLTIPPGATLGRLSVLALQLSFPGPATIRRTLLPAVLVGATVLLTRGRPTVLPWRGILLRAPAILLTRIAATRGRRVSILREDVGITLHRRPQHQRRCWPERRRRGEEDQRDEPQTRHLARIEEGCRDRRIAVHMRFCVRTVSSY